MAEVTPELEIRVHLADARVLSFVVSEPGEADRILEQIVPGRFFEERQIAIGCKGSLTALQTSLIAQVELISDLVPDWAFHHNVRIIQEVSPHVFHEKYAHITHVDRSYQEVVTVSSEIELSNGENIYLSLEVNSDPAISPLTPLDQHVFLQQIFTSHGMYARHKDRGALLINPAYIARLTMHPGPEIVPAGAWRGCAKG
jgi:hypothetical protein